MATGKTNFYRRPLPNTCVSFTSQEGRELFHQSLAAGHMESYFPLAAQFRTQDEPAYCGLTTLVMVLNASSVDPVKTWKGPWRWYHEDMLDCCVPLTDVQLKGITMEEFNCLASCNGLRVQMTRPPLVLVGVEPSNTIKQSSGASASSGDKSCEVTTDCKDTQDEFRRVVQRVTGQGEQFMVASYSRKVLDQTGDGHFSPVAGYNPDNDLVLILDTARFKYPPHWVPLRLLWQAMQAVDKDTGMSRGYFLLQKCDKAHLILFKISDYLSLHICQPLLHNHPLDEMRSYLNHVNQLEEFVCEDEFDKNKFLAISIRSLTKALSVFKTGEFALTMDVAAYYQSLKSNDSNTAKQMLMDLEHTSVFKLVNKLVREEDEIRILADKAGNAEEIGCKSCLQEQSNTPKQAINQKLRGSAENTETEKDITASETESIQVTSEHYLAMLLLSWPYQSCGERIRHVIDETFKAELGTSSDQLQMEVRIINHQLQTLMDYKDSCKNCNANVLCCD